MYIFMELLPVVVAYLSHALHCYCAFMLYPQYPSFLLCNMLYLALYFFPEPLILFYFGKYHFFFFAFSFKACQQGQHHRGPDIKYFFAEKLCFYPAWRRYFRFQSFQKLALDAKRLFQVIYAELLALYDVYLFLPVAFQQFFVKNYYPAHELVDRMLDFGYVIPR